MQLGNRHELDLGSHDGAVNEETTLTLVPGNGRRPEAAAIEASRSHHPSALPPTSAPDTDIDIESSHPRPPGLQLVWSNGRHLNPSTPEPVDT